ncbi:MAG: hypothetical protein ACYDCP_09960 [Thermoplasmataceae archaeon]
MKRIALLNSASVVITVALWDGVSAWQPVGIGGCASTVDVTSNAAVGTGCTYANGVFTAPTVTKPPDVDGFGVAVLADTSISMSTRLLVDNWVPGLGLALGAGNVSLISTAWADMIAQYSISSTDQSAVSALAATYAIPGL